MATTEQFSGFIRQRRNLILISLVLLFAQVHSVTFKKFSIFGTEIDIAKPLDPEMYIWIAFFYLLWRYYVYFHDEGDKQFKSIHRSRLTTLIERIMVKRLENDPDAKKVLNTYLEQIGAAKWRFLQSSYSTPHSNSKFQMSLNLKLVGYREKDGIHSMDFPADIEMQVQGFEYLRTSMRAWLYVLFRTYTFSEYIVPFIIASIPMVYAVCRLCRFANS